MNRLRILILGAFNGAIYGAVMLMLVWQLRAYAYARNLKDAAITGDSPVQLTTNDRWLPILVTWILIFAFVALLVRRFWPRNRSSLLFWEASGLLAVAAWNVLILVAFSLERGLFPPTLSYSWATSSSDPLSGPVSLGVVLAVNLVYSQIAWFFERRGPTQNPSFKPN